MSRARIVRIWYRTRSRAILWNPLERPRRALAQLPLIPKKVLEEIIAPFCRRPRPDPFQPAGDGMPRISLTPAIVPAKALLFDHGRRGLFADIFPGIRRAVSLPEAMPTRNQRHGLFIIHRHPPERFPDIPRRSQRIRFSIRPLRVDIDQTHLDRAKRILQVAVAFIPFVAQPFLFRTPIGIFRRLPDVLAAPAKTEGLEP